MCLLHMCSHVYGALSLVSEQQKLCLVGFISGKCVVGMLDRRRHISAGAAELCREVACMKGSVQHNKTWSQLTQSSEVSMQETGPYTLYTVYTF